MRKGIDVVYPPTIFGSYPRDTGLKYPAEAKQNKLPLDSVSDTGKSYRVLHVLDHSWPVMDGYSQRSRSLIAAQACLDFRPTVLTSPLHQQDDPGATEISLDGVTYFRTPCDKYLSGRAIRDRWPLAREISVVRLLKNRIQDLLDTEAFDLVHAHSPALCGLAALLAARSRGIPLIYEIRSFWEDSPLVRSTTWPGHIKYQLARNLETYIARHADAVVGIARPILEELKGREIPADKLFHVPNGVDVARFVPRPRDIALARELGIDESPTLGDLGTFFLWEGVAWMVRAAADLKRQGIEFRFLIVGDGADAPEVKKAIEETGVGASVRWLGRVSHDQVDRYYSVMDVLVYPRLRTRLTDLVTPLKPLEAMALGKAVLASAVGGLRELIEPEVTGVLFDPGDRADFCRQATRLLLQPDLRRKLGEKARSEVISRKDWKSLARQYESVYEAAIRAKPRF